MTQNNTDWWVDGHYIAADSAEEALDTVRSEYAPRVPETVRPWTGDDQIALDWQTTEHDGPDYDDMPCRGCEYADGSPHDTGCPR